MTPVQSPFRLEALHRTGLMDSPPEEAFDRLTRLAAMTLGVRVAIVSLVGSDRQFFKSCIGADEPLATVRETPLSHSFCQYAVASGEPLIVEDARTHPVVRDNPAVRDYGVRAYVGIPLVTPDGHTLGTFCVMDTAPRAWTDRDIGVLTDLAAATVTEIVLRNEVAERTRVEQERARLVRALELEQQRIASLFEQAPAFIAAARGPEHRFEMANQAYYQLVGFRDIIGKPVADAIPEAAEQGLVSMLDRVLATGEPFVAKGMRILLQPERGAEPDERFVDFVYQPFVESDGSRSGVFCHGVDVTEQRRAAKALRESEERYRLLFDSNPLPMWVYDTESLGFLAVNNAAIAHYGYSREEFLSMSITAIRPAGAIESVLAEVRSAGSGEKHLAAWQHLLKDGTIIDVDVTSRPMVYDGRQCRLLLSHDVTERRRVERALRASEGSFRGLVDSAHEGVWVLDTVGRTTYVNPRMTEMLGYTPEAMLGRAMFDFMEPAAAFETRTLFARRQRGIGESHDLAFRRSDGTEFWTMVSSSALYGTDGEFVGALAMVSDITERRRAGAALRESEARLRLALEVANISVWERELTCGGVGDTVHPEEDVRAPDDACGSYATFLAAVHPEDRDRVARLNAEAVAQRGEFSTEFRMAGTDGTPHWIQTMGRVLLDTDGRPDRMIGVTHDVTNEVTLQAQLRQAQKMEAVGQLAGGVAHDFNNLLTVITAGVMFAREALPPGSAALEELALVDEAAGRAALLTRQLLAFSRKQVLKPELLDLNRVIRGVEPMLRRLIGEDIQVLTIPAPELGLVLADPGQLEQVLVNLAVNARDAMPHGGRIVIETTSVTLTADESARRGAVIAPGTYVRLTVRDTGVGMDEATLARAFEPFFTTKGPGRGSGLGLATVYGVVKQSGGYVWASSVPDRGTTFDIDLPQAAAAIVSNAVDGATPEPARASGTVLLIEDEAPVRMLTRRVLVRQGYTVLEAAHGREALTIADNHTGRIDLVVTDMVMPEMSGRAFAEQFGAQHPDTRVLFMSGYTDDEIIRRGLLAPGMAFLEKPFTPNRLLEAVHGVLSG